jgi:pyruvate carboxylase subunit B
MKKILFQDTSFRDGFQSVFGARVLTEDFIPAVQAARHAGITHFEAGGGARFQSLFMYCGESAFDMMDKFREAAGPDANLQTLARGINVVALSAQPKDMIDLHAKMFKKHGITHIRNFDALNDVRNLVYSGHAIKNAGLHHQVAITIMELPPGCEGAHDVAFYMKTLREILDSGLPFDSIVFKDASGTANPGKVHETVKAARAMVGKDVKLWIHSHETVGNGISQYRAAIEADIDGVCVGRSPVSGGTGQPDLMSMWHNLKGSNYSIDIDVNKIMEANAVFKDCLKDYFFPPEALAISPEVILSPMPGGALTANTMMMRDTGTLHLYPQVIEAMSECVRKGGFGTSVTPVSQFYFQQAYANVTQGPWKKITEGYGNMVLGYFGRTPVAPDPEIVKIASEQMGKPVFTGDPLDIIEPGIPEAKAILEKNGLPVTDENIFIVGAHKTTGGNKGLDFLRGNCPVNVRKISKEDKKESSASGSAKTGSGDYTVNVDGKPSHVAVTEGSGKGHYSITIDGKVHNVTVSEGGVVTAAAHGGHGHAHVAGTEVKANLPGNVYRMDVEVGETVAAGDTILVLEAMKMETPVVAPIAGKILALEVEKGTVVQSGDVLAVIG